MTVSFNSLFPLKENFSYEEENFYEAAIKAYGLSNFSSAIQLFNKSLKNNLDASRRAIIENYIGLCHIALFDKASAFQVFMHCFLSYKIYDINFENTLFLNLFNLFDHKETKNLIYALLNDATNSSGNFLKELLESYSIIQNSQDSIVLSSEKFRSFLISLKQLNKEYFAIKYVLNLIRLKPEKSWGNTYIKTFKEVFLFQKKAKEYSPEFKMEYLTFCLSAGLFYFTHNFIEAKNCFQEGLQTCYEDLNERSFTCTFYLHRQLGLLLLKNGYIKQALEHLKKAELIGNEQQKQILFEKLGLAYLEQHHLGPFKVRLAIQALEKVINMQQVSNTTRCRCHLLVGEIKCAVNPIFALPDALSSDIYLTDIRARSAVPSLELDFLSIRIYILFGKIYYKSNRECAKSYFQSSLDLCKNHFQFNKYKLTCLQFINQIKAIEEEEQKSLAF